MKMEILTAETAVKYVTVRKGKSKAQIAAIVEAIAKYGKAIKDACEKNENLGVILTAKEMLNEDYIAGGSGTVAKADDLIEGFILRTYHEKRKNKKVTM